MERVLITGANGTIGRRLTSRLISAGYDIVKLTRNSDPDRSGIKSYRWDPEKDYIDPAALPGVTHIIHLAGENISGRRWSQEVKQSIVSSRVKSAEFLFRKVCEGSIRPKTFISASATGFYGAVTSEKIFNEDDKPSGDFLSDTCVLWEEAAARFENRGTRWVSLRTGVVLARGSGLLQKLTPVFRRGLGSVPGNGKQYISWIHIDDLCEIYLKALNDEKMSGVYNAVSPGWANADTFYRQLSEAFGRRLWLPRIPRFLLKIILGEMSSVITAGSRVSPDKILKTGYIFKYKDLREALGDLST